MYGLIKKMSTMLSASENIFQRLPTFFPSSAFTNLILRRRTLFRTRVRSTHQETPYVLSWTISHVEWSMVSIVNDNHSMIYFIYFLPGWWHAGISTVPSMMLVTTFSKTRWIKDHLYSNWRMMGVDFFWLGIWHFNEPVRYNDLPLALRGLLNCLPNYQCHHRPT